MNFSVAVVFAMSPGNFFAAPGKNKMTPRKN